MNSFGRIKKLIFTKFYNSCDKDHGYFILLIELEDVFRKNYTLKN